jgi:hypothetical protein
MLLKTYESAAAITLQGSDTLSPTNTSSYWMSRYDCVLYIGQVFQSIYKIYRDGTAVRCSGSQGQIAFLGYDLNEDLVFTNMHLSTPHSNWYNDPIGLKYDFTKPAALTHTGWVLPDATFNAFVWGNNYYTGSVATIK